MGDFEIGNAGDYFIGRTTICRFHDFLATFVSWCKRDLKKYFDGKAVEIEKRIRLVVPPY